TPLPLCLCAGVNVVVALAGALTGAVKRRGTGCVWLLTNGCQCFRVRSIRIVHAELHVLFKCFWANGTNFEVHHRVVSTAHFRTAAYESAFFSNFRDLEGTLLLVRLWVSVSIALEQELWNPECVGYVARSQTDSIGVLVGNTRTGISSVEPKVSISL